jgi:predicted DNA-binding transcriptional regulator YafY
MPWGINMMTFTLNELSSEFPDNESCLELLKNKIYPDGIKCPVCKKVTKHHKLTNRPCYCCDYCGHQVHPTAGTIFHKSTTPLQTWFKVIYMVSSARRRLSAKEIQREHGMTYKTARHMLLKIMNILDKNTISPGDTSVSGDKYTADKVNSHIKMPNTTINTKVRNITSVAPKIDKPLRIRTAARKVNEDTNLHAASLPNCEQFIIMDNFEQNEKPLGLFRKRDRTVRLLKVQMLLWQHLDGLSVEEIARKCFVSQRTAYRDLEALESELGTPIWGEGNKRGVAEGYFLPAVPFTLKEAINIFLAARLMHRCPFVYNPSLVSTIMKLNNVIPPPLRQQVTNTLEQMERQPRDKRKIDNFNKLTEAWLSQHMVKISYRYEDEIIERIIDPYFIEPSALSNSNYLIAYSHFKDSIEVFKIDNISGNVHVCPDTYEIPSDFNAIDYISHSWGVHIDDNELITAKIHFSRKSNVMETIWHPSQVMQTQKDGSVILTLRVRNTRDFLQWVLGWGVEAEVLEPELLKNQIIKHTQALLGLYNLQNTGNNKVISNC